MNPNITLAEFEKALDDANWYAVKIRCSLTNGWTIRVKNVETGEMYKTARCGTLLAACELVLTHIGRKNVQP